MLRESEDFKKTFEDMLAESRKEKSPLENNVDLDSSGEEILNIKPKEKTLYKVFEDKQTLKQQLPELPPMVGEKKKGSAFVQRGVVKKYDPSQRKEPKRYDPSQRKG